MEHYAAFFTGSRSLRKDDTGAAHTLKPFSDIQGNVAMSPVPALHMHQLFICG